MTLPYEASTVNQVLPRIMKDLLEFGDEVGSRNGRVKELLNPQIILTDPVRREVLSLNRKANVFAQIAETMWVLSGRNDIKWLSAYLPRAVEYSDDGEVWRAGYGPRIRNWWGLDTDNSPPVVDQLAYVVDTLTADPLSRQAVIGIWDPAVDTTPGKDKACNTFLQFQSRKGMLHLTVTVRSNDVMWGWSGINAFEWSTLQEMVASILGIEVGKLVFNIGSLHLYEQHWAKAKQIEYEDIQYRTIRFDPHRTVRSVANLDALIAVWFAWEELCRKGDVTFDLFKEWFEEPLTKSWAAAIAYFWTRDKAWLKYLSGTALAVAIARTPANALSEAPQTSRSGAVGQPTTGHPHERVRAFYEYVKNLHFVKHTSYGDSWKKRGEKMSILANMARKVDRLGVGDEFDSSVDTVIDLLVYAIKYRCWLDGEEADPVAVNLALGHYLGETEVVQGAHAEGEALDVILGDIAIDFDYYADNLDGLSVEHKREFISDLIVRLTPIARDLWYEGRDEYRGADHE